MLFEAWVPRRSANSDLGCAQKILGTAALAYLFRHYDRIGIIFFGHLKKLVYDRKNPSPTTRVKS